MNKKRISKEILPGAKYLSALAAGVITSSALLSASMGAMAAGVNVSLQPAKALSLTEAMVDEVVAARKKFGFRHDQAYVSELLTRPESYGAVFGALTGGFYATKEEVKELEIRLRVQEDGLAILRNAQKDRDFAGLYVDQSGHMHIGFTKSSIEKVNSFRKGAKEPKRIHAFKVSRSMAELEKQKKRIVDASPKLAAEGINVSEVAIDIATNTVRVGVVNLNSAQRANIVSRFGKVDVFENAIDVADLRSDTASPMRAGVRITNQSGGSCTSNWKARDRSNGALVMLTAGHCASEVSGTLGGPGTWTYQGQNANLTARKVGISDQTTWTFPTINPMTGARSGASPVDAMRIPFLSGIASMPWLYAYDNANAGVFSNGEKAPVGDADGTVVVGTAVCSAGQYSPGNQVGGSNFKNCGTVSSVNVAKTFTRQLGSPDTFTVQNGNVADYIAIPGDSGAPVWRLSYDATAGYEVVAVGHHTGGPTGSEFFNNIDLVEDALNVDIVTF